MKNEPSIIMHYIETINTEGVNLSKWELGFMESITEQWERYQKLSDRQEEFLEKIYAAKTP